MRLGVVDGPGHHGPTMTAQLVALGHEVVATRAVPHFSVVEHRPGLPPRQRTRPRDRVPHDLLRRLAAGSQRRLRRWLQKSYDFDLYTRLYGRLAAPYLADCDAVIGFSLVSYQAHARAKKLGRPTVLELAATHLARHLALVEEEYQRAGQTTAAEGISFSRFAVDRAEAEYRQADLIDVLSTYAKQTLVDRGIPPERLSVSLPGVDVDRFRPGPPPAGSARPFRVLFVGRLELAKGVRYLLEAFALARLPDAELWLIGPLHREMEPFLRQHGRGVVVRGPLPLEEVAACYRSADVFVFPTLSDSFGLVMLEAMASGLPVVATARSGAPDVLREARDGFVVPACDAAALGDRIAWLHGHPAERTRMGHEARARVEAMFTETHYGQRLETGLIRRIDRLRDRGGSAAAPPEIETRPVLR